MLLDRMVNLLSRGCVVPMLQYIKLCVKNGDVDISLIRYFITEVFIGFKFDIFCKKHTVVEAVGAQGG